MVDAGTDGSTGGSVISLPSGGGAIGGLGETFSPDLFTGTGNFTVPIALPLGRRGLAPQLSLTYSTGNGNGSFGLGWALSLPGVARKTSRGVPRYGDDDTFVLSGAEELVPVGAGTYRPRTEGLFARIERVGDHWEVRSRDGLRTRYGTPPPPGAVADRQDPAVTAGPDGVFAWRITETSDLLGNLVRYSYRRDRGEADGHRWDQPLIDRIDYADFGDRDAPRFLVGVEFDHEDRPDPFSDHRAGFEIRTTQRCRTIRVVTTAADGVRRGARVPVRLRAGAVQRGVAAHPDRRRRHRRGVRGAPPAADLRVRDVRPGRPPVPGRLRAGAAVAGRPRRHPGRPAGQRPCEGKVEPSATSARWTGGSSWHCCHRLPRLRRGGLRRQRAAGRRRQHPRRLSTGHPLDPVGALPELLR